MRFGKKILEILIENEFENNNENVINTEGFGLSQNSDSNNSLNIEDSDTESENELLNMANQDQIKRIIENAVRLTANALDHALGQGQTLADRIQTARNGGIVGMPTFSGKEDEDVNDWIRQFETAFIVSWKNRRKYWRRCM
ncbi:unnamed protein product [Rhizophagus irregularis]|nr:unnamed protein product [Rhizophagus irregularis]